MMERGGKVILRVCENVQQSTIEPIIREVVEEGSMINTDEYGIYNKLRKWGYEHETINHGMGEYARDADGDGINEVHVNTIEGVWSLLRPW